ncbi:hypothetical protein N9Y00_11510 [Tateyamaria sp.]|nr:hypothetical protein [Tateyamaria sp.]
MGGVARHQFFAEANDADKEPDGKTSANNNGPDAYLKWFSGLDFQEALVLAFDCVPSELNRLFWRFTRNDLSIKIRLYLGQKQAEALQDFQNIALVASQLFGGKKNEEAKKVETPQTEGEMLSAFANVFGNS